MAQLVTVKLVRHDNTPWGFRLQGGKDFGTPLLIQKVNGGSIAERAGLAVGDGLVTVNGYDVFNLKHKEAQDAIVQGGNCLELQVQRGGGSTWKPLVQNVGATPSPLSHLNGTSNGQVKAIVNKQYNTPVGMYSEETIAETLSAQAEVLAGGVIGVNFKKNEKNYDAQKSEVFKMVHEVDAEPKSPEPVPPSSAAYFATSSHAVGGRATSPRPLTPMAQQIAYGSPTNPFVVAKETTELPAATATVADPPNCSECGKIVVGVFVRIKDKNLHVECFKCATCGTSLKNVGYYTINNKLYCDIHAKMIARQNPPAPNLEPITVSPGGRIPSNVVSNAVSSAMSPKSNPVSSPFQTPNANVLSPKSYNGTAAPLTPPISRNFSQPQTDKKESGKIIWPPVETEEKYPTATPGYYPPPTVKVTKADSKGDDLSTDPSSEADTPSAFKPVKPTFKEQLNSHISLIEHPPQFKFFHPAASKIVTFSEEVNEAAERKESQNITPTEGYPLTRQLSVCSQEVLRALAVPNSTDGLPVKLDAEKAIEVIEDEGRCPSPVPFSPSSEDLQAIQNQANNNLGEGMLKKCAHRAPTPIPILDVDDSISEMMEEPGNTVQELVEALERHCKTTMLTDAQATALADALTTAPERPYTPLQTSLVPIVPEPPEKAPRKLTSHYGFSKDAEPEQFYDTKSVKELPKPKFETGLMARAMMIAPPIPYHTLKPSMTEPVTIPKPVPLPPPTKPYFPSSDSNKDEDPDSSRGDCNSPLMHALMTAPERCYSPLPSVVEPPSPPSGPLPSLDIDYIVKPPSFEKEEEEEHKSAFVGPLKGKRLVPCVKDLSELRLESKGKESLLFPEQQLGGPQLPHLATELHKPVCIPPYQENLGDTPYRPKTPRSKIRAPEINPPPYNRNTSNSDQSQSRQSTHIPDFNKVAKKTVSPSKISFLNASNNENKVPVLGYQPKSISSAPLIKDYDNLVSQLETHITKEAVQKHLSNLHHATFAPITATTKFKPGSLLY